MKRSNYVTRLVTLILFLFLLVYFGANFVQSMQNPLRTAPAIAAQAEEGFFAPGILIREEHVIHVPQPVVASLVREGERVSVGMAYLLVYASEADRAIDVRRMQLEYEIGQLEAQLSAYDGLRQAAETEAEIRRQIREISYLTHGGNLDGLETQTVALRALALAGDRAGLSGRLESLRAARSDLGSMSAPARAIEAERAGVYSTRVDGFEHLGRQDIADLNAANLRGLLERRYVEDDILAGAGKLVTGSTWYYAALVPAEELPRLQRLLDPTAREAPNRLLVSFSGLGTADVPMRVYALGEAEDGYAKAVFAANTALVETLRLRQVEARIIYDVFHGIRVPREALHRGEWDEERGENLAYVLTLTIGAAEQKFVVVVYEGRDYYLVRPDMDRSSVEAALREGNTIIVHGRNLYDGRVFR